MKKYIILLALCISSQLYGQITLSSKKSPKEDMGWDIWNTYEVVPDKYLIVTVSEYQNDIQEFIQWKKITGKSVFVSMKSRGTWTTDEVLDTVSFYFQEHGIKYLLIVGGKNDVPSINNSDYYYGLPAVSSHIPQILRGRIPISTGFDVRNVFRKIINYEKTPTNDTAFYKKGIHCAEFVDDEYTLYPPPPRPGLVVRPDGYEDKCFTLISEEIRYHLKENWGKNVNYIYHAEDSVFPMNWAIHEYSNGDSIPYELTRNNYEWNGNTGDIIGEVNDGAFYVLYNGYGETDRWVSPSFSSTDVNNLHNGNKLPVVFSMSDDVGKIHSDSLTCLAEELLKKENGGSVAIIASTQFTSPGNNGALTLAMFDAVWPRLQLQYGNFRLDAIRTGGYWWELWGDSIWIDTYRRPVYTSGPPHSPIKEIGAILDYGLERITNIISLENDIPNEWMAFHCFGDPSMVFLTEKPRTFVEPTIFIQNDTAFVMVSDGDCQITFYHYCPVKVD